ncbi:Ig-like domain-containing protein [Roseovarius pelagicus]|nr:Ig-like domain-containing protein [Roseovarius pelagicus]
MKSPASRSEDDGETVTMLGAAAGILGGTGLLGAAGAGAAVIAATQVVGAGDDTPARIEPSIDQDTDISIGGDDGGDGSITISGKAQPGSDVAVTIGDKTVETQAGPDGNWNVVFQGDTFPSDGDHTVTVVVTEPGGTKSDLTGPVVAIDTTPPATDVTEGTVTTGDITNAAEYDAGVQVSGTGEAGSIVSVTIQEVIRETVVTESGNWTVTFEKGTLAEGEYDSEVTVVARDAAGNSTTITDTIRIDTVANDVTISTATIEGDGVVNGTEMAGGLDVTGTATPGAEIVVTVEGVERTVVANAGGEWVATYAAGSLPNGTYDAAITATTTDVAGNVNSTTGTIRVDTSVENFSITSQSGGADGVINAAEAQAGLTVTGTSEPGSTVTVELGGAIVNAVVGADGSWAATFNAGQIAAGTYTADMVATATDAAGNISTLTNAVNVDTDAGALSINTAAVGGDGTVNAAETAAGVSVTGTADPGATVVVSLAGVERTVIAGAGGTWTAIYAPGSLPDGQYDAPVTATTSDSAGNSTTTSGTIQVDTFVENFAVTSQAGGADGVLNAAEATSGLTVSGTGEPGSSVSVQLGGVTVQAVVAANGSWTAGFAAGQIAQGTYVTDLVATATDAAGNVSTRTSQVQVDTEAGTLTLNTAQIGGDGTINAAEAQAGVVVSGTANPGATVTVTLDGVAHQAVAGANGVWQTTYAQHEIIAGVHDPQVTATITDAAGNTASVDGTVHVDTRVDNLNLTPPRIGVAADGQDLINNAIASAGFDITGTVEPGSTVVVTIAGVPQQAVVDANGNWTAHFPPGSIPPGEYDAPLSVDVTDAAGNTSSINDTVRVDTLVNQLERAGAIETDNVVNAAEALDGVTLTGTVEPGSTVQLTVLGKTYNAVVDAAGNWSVDIPAGDIPQVEQDFAMVITATDNAGNVTTVNDTLSIDTVVPDQPDIVGYFREGGGYRSVTLDTPDDPVTIHQIDGGGNVNELSLHASADPFLGETDYHFLDGAGAPTRIPDGSQLIVTSSDAAGNASSTFVVLDETDTAVVNVSNANLANFQIETIDLRFGDQSDLTLTDAQIRGLSDSTDTVVVHGGADDKLTIAGGQQTGQTQVDGQTHDIYTLGNNGATIVVDDDINVIT